MNNRYYESDLNIRALKIQLSSVSKSKEEGINTYLVNEHILKTYIIINNL